MVIIITNPYDMANTFNNYFASIAETNKKSIKYSHKHFSDYFQMVYSTIFLQHTGKEEIANIISSSINSCKASSPNSIPYRIFPQKNEILGQLPDLFNLSSMTGLFPSVLKTAKVVPVITY